MENVAFAASGKLQGLLLFLLHVILLWKLISNSCDALAEFLPLKQRTGHMAIFVIGATCYSCRVLKRTCACARINTHNLKNVFRRFEYRGFPLCWPDVRAAAGSECVAALKNRATGQHGRQNSLQYVLKPNI